MPAGALEDGPCAQLVADGAEAKGGDGHGDAHGEPHQGEPHQGEPHHQGPQAKPPPIPTKTRGPQQQHPRP